MSMTDDERLKAIHCARETYADDDINIDFEPDEVSDADEAGCWVRAWVWVPREAYQDSEAGSEVVSGG